MARIDAPGLRLLALTLMALATLVILWAGQGQAETYREVELYLKNPEPGLLDPATPDESVPWEVDIVTNSPNPAGYEKVGTWTSDDLARKTNLSGEWGFALWAKSDQNIDLDLRVTLRRAGSDITNLVGEATVTANQDTEITAVGNLPATTEWDTNPIEIYVESRWDLAQGATGQPTSIKFRYGTPSIDGKLRVNLNLVEIEQGSTVVHDDEAEWVKIFALITTPFNTDPLTKDDEDYSINLNWNGGQDSSDSNPEKLMVTNYRSKGAGYEVTFTWSYGGKSLPAGTNTYSVGVSAVDGWLREEWSDSFEFDLFIKPIPKLSISANPQSKEVKVSKYASYTITISNPGTGPADFELTAVSTFGGDEWRSELVEGDSISVAAGDKVNIHLRVYAPAEGEDEDEDYTTVTIINNTYDLEESLEFTTVLVVPPPKYEVELKAARQTVESWDFEEVVYELTIFNRGNRDDSFDIKELFNPGGLNFLFTPSRDIALAPQASTKVTLTLTPRADFATDQTTWPFSTDFTVEAISNTDSTATHSLNLRLESKLSTEIVLQGSNAEVTAKQGENVAGSFTLINLQPRSVLVYFEAEVDKASDDQLSTIPAGWFSFYDEIGDEIKDSSPLTMNAESTVDVTYKIGVSSRAKAGQEYPMLIRAYNEEGKAVSTVGTLTLTTQKAEEDSNNIWMVAVALVGVIAIGGAVVYLKPWAAEDDEDEDDDVDEMLDSDEPAPLAAESDELPSTLDGDTGPLSPGLPSLSFDSSAPSEEPAPLAPPLSAETLPPPIPGPEPMAPPLPSADIPPMQPLPPMQPPPMADGQTPLPPPMPMADQGMPPLPQQPFMPPQPMPDMAAPPMQPMPAPPMAAQPPLPAQAPFQPAPMAPQPMPPMQPMPGMAPPQPMPMAPMQQPMPFAPAPVEPVVVAAEPVVVEAVAVEPIVVAAEPVAVQPVVVVAEQQ